MKKMLKKRGQFDKIWQHFKDFLEFLKALLTIWQNFEPTLASILCYRTNLHCYK